MIYNILLISVTSNKNFSFLHSNLFLAYLSKSSTASLQYLLKGVLLLSNMLQIKGSYQLLV